MIAIRRAALLLGATWAALGAVAPAGAAPSPKLCDGPLTGRTIAVRQAGFGATQAQPPLPLRANEYVLTFDDGPNPKTTRQLLAILHARCVPAAFMMVGFAAAAHPDLVRAVVADGQVAGSHSFSHKGFGAMTPAQRDIDVARGADAVEAAATGRPRAPGAWRFFRIPGDAGAPRVPDATWMATLAREHLILAGYDISPADWRNDGAEAAYARLMPHLPDRGVIVMHDWPDGTPKLLDMVLTELARRGARIVRIVPAAPTATAIATTRGPA